MIQKQLPNPPLNLLSPRLNSPGFFNTSWSDMILSPFFVLVTLPWMGSSLSLKNLASRTASNKRSRCGQACSCQEQHWTSLTHHTHVHKSTVDTTRCQHNRSLRSSSGDCKCSAHVRFAVTLIPVLFIGKTGNPATLSPTCLLNPKYQFQVVNASC
jgi:hypothetical protein